MRVLVTGGLGFIGSFTVDRLIESGYSVRCLDNLENQVHHSTMPKDRNEKAEYLISDIRHRKSWVKALNDVDYVIHLAAAVGVGQSFWQARKYISTNVLGTATLFETLIKEKEISREIKKIIVASSKSIYGEGSYRCKAHGILNPPPRPIEQLRRREWEVKCPVCGENVKPIGIKEDKPPQNLSPYALSKYATEALALDYSAALGIPVVAFRYFNVFGPRQSLSNPYAGVIAIFLSRIKNGMPPILFEDGKQLRDYVYVEDVARLNVEAVENDSKGVFNVGTGEAHSLLDVVDSLNRIYGSKVKPNITQKFRLGDNRHDFADCSKLIKSFGSTKFTPFMRGLEKLVEWAEDVQAIDLFDRAEKERVRFLGSEY
jgi:dTDP-L-rhamnose 4-epimerase